MSWRAFIFSLIEGRFVCTVVCVGIVHNYLDNRFQFEQYNNLAPAQKIGSDDSKIHYLGHV